jgi:hypothetical protein
VEKNAELNIGGLRAIQPRGGELAGETGDGGIHALPGIEHLLFAGECVDQGLGFGTLRRVVGELRDQFSVFDDEIIDFGFIQTFRSPDEACEFRSKGNSPRGRFVAWLRVEDLDLRAVRWHEKQCHADLLLLERIDFQGW